MTGARMRVAIGGMAIESSTFSPHRSGAADFTVVRGPELLARYDRLPAHIDWLPLVHARALPGGAVEREFYEEIKAELLEGLRRAAPLDGLFFDIHGAMTVSGMTDAEGDLAAAIRDAVGPRCLISASMDPHGNMSRHLAGALDLATSHRMSPHEDAPQTKIRAVTNLVACLDGGTRPRRAWVRVPVLLPGERACTRDEPARGIYGSLPSIASRDCIIDAAVWIGYAWADEPRCSAAVVVTGTDEAAVTDAARELAQRYWDARARFAFSAPAAEAASCIANGLSQTERPFFISDSGDNPTAGGAGDGAYMLGQLLDEPRLASGAATAIWASCVDPIAVAACVRAGERGTVAVRVGGTFGSPWSVPVDGTVHRIRPADPVGGNIAVVAAGGVRAILTTRRKPYHHLSDFTELGLDPVAHDLTVVKVGYLVPELFDAAKGWVIALTPGGVDQHIVRLPYRALDRPIFPLDPNMPDPRFDPEILRS
ncbi:MAG: M81 family metallopeptidase [Chloroflexota bacterium]|nr:M81 family metallopeptidase [Chloroflexota bacterium]